MVNQSRPAADGAVEHLRVLLDAVGRGVQRLATAACVAWRFVHRGMAYHPIRVLSRLRWPDDRIRRIRQRRHPIRRASPISPNCRRSVPIRIQALGELQDLHLLPFLAAIVSAVDG